MADQSDIWTPEDFDPALGDLAYVDYQDLVDQLRKDLQLNLATDVQPKSLTQALLAPQRYGIVQNALDSIPTSASYALLNWSVASSGTYFKATPAGLTVLASGIVLASFGVLYNSSSAGVRYAELTDNGSLYGGNFFSGVPTVAAGNDPAMSGMRSVQCAEGDVLSVGCLQNSGAAATLASSFLSAVYLCPTS